MGFGPYENDGVADDESAAQQYYMSREIKLRNPSMEARSTYQSDFVPKTVAGRRRPETAPDFVAEGRTGRTSYQADYVPFALPRRPAKPAVSLAPPLRFAAQTTAQASYTGAKTRLEPPAADANNLFPDRKFDAKSLYQMDFTRKAVPDRRARAKPGVTPSEPLRDATTHKTDFQKWPLGKKPPADHNRRMHMEGRVFRDETTTGDYKDWKVKPRRQTVGVQYNKNGLYFPMIKRSAPLPATSKQVFTTVRDYEADACFLIKKGESGLGAENQTIGQLDLAVPPAKKDVPRMEVTFNMDTSNNLTVSVTDLDTKATKGWKGNEPLVKAT